MATFRLTSDNYFLRTFHNSPDILVFDFQGDITSYDIILSPSSHWPFCARIGDSQQHKTLEVFGTTISGDKLAQLASDLTLKSGPQTFYLLVNREGLCFLSVNNSVVKRVRINDYFGWSKYGVKPELGTVWNKFELFDQRIVVDLEGMKKSLSEFKDRDAELSESLISKNKALEICKSQLTENRTELSGLKKILDEMKRSLSESKDREVKLSESLLSKSEELEICKSQLMENRTGLSGLKKILDDMMKSLSESKDREAELSQSLLSKSEALEICKSQLTENRTELSGLEKILDDMKKSLSESKDMEAELSESLLSKSEALEICKCQLIENRTELSGLKEIMEQMKNDKGKLEKKGIEKAESGEEWKKLAEEREDELRKVKSQLVGKMKHADTLKDAADSLMNSLWDLNKLARREMMVFWNLAVLKAGSIPSSLRTRWINNQVK